MIRLVARTLVSLVVFSSAFTQAIADEHLSSKDCYNWTGIYLGLNGGYAFGTHDPLSLFSSNFNAFSYNANGGLIGGTFGAQIQSGNVVMGLEADIDWTNISGSGTGPVGGIGPIVGTGTLSSTTSVLTTLRARTGFAWENWLFYATTGLTLDNTTSTFTQTTGFQCGTDFPCTSKANLHLGMALGGGIEYGILPFLSAKVEYLWLGAGAVNTMYGNLIRAGVNFRFGG